MFLQSPWYWCIAAVVSSVLSEVKVFGVFWGFCCEVLFFSCMFFFPLVIKSCSCSVLHLDNRLYASILIPQASKKNKKKGGQVLSVTF